MFDPKDFSAFDVKFAEYVPEANTAENFISILVEPLLDFKAAKDAAMRRWKKGDGDVVVFGFDKDSGESKAIWVKTHDGREYDYDYLKRFVADANVKDVIKKEREGYVIYSEKGKRLSKAYPTKEAAEKRLKQIEMFKHMKSDAVSKTFDVYYFDEEKDQICVEKDVKALTANLAKKITKDKLGNKISGYPQDAVLKGDSMNMAEEAKAWLEKFLVKKDDPSNKLGKTHIRPLRNEERLPKGVKHKAATDRSGILHYKDGDYYWTIDENDELHVEKTMSHDSIGYRFVGEAFFDDKRKGLAASEKSNDLEKIKAWVFEQLNKGYECRIIDKMTGEIWLPSELEDVEDIRVEDAAKPEEIDLETCKRLAAEIRSKFKVSAEAGGYSDIECETVESGSEEDEAITAFLKGKGFEVAFDGIDDAGCYSISKPVEPLHLWIVEWLNPNGVKFFGEFDSEEDAKDFIETHSDGEHLKMKIREEDRLIGDSMEEIEVTIEGVADDLIEKAYEEYCKCAEKERFEYSEKLTDLLNEISKYTKTTEKELLDQFAILFEKEGVPVKDSLNEVSKEKATAKVKAILRKWLLKQGYEDDVIDEYLVIRAKPFDNGEDKGVKFEIANDLDIDFYDLPDELVKELEGVVGWIEPDTPHIWSSVLWDKVLVDADEAKETHVVKYVIYTQYDLGYGDVEIDEDQTVEEEYPTYEEAKEAADRETEYAVPGQYVEVYIDGRRYKEYDVD